MGNKSISQRGTEEARENIRQARQDDLRERLQGIEYLNQIEKASKQLITIQNMLRRKQSKLTTVEISATKARISAIKLGAEINFKRLAKLLPDLRSVEFTDDEGKNPLKGLVDAIMRNQGDVK